MSDIRVKDLHDEVSGKDCGNLKPEDHPRYRVVAVLNSGDGPDERVIPVAEVSWDHDMGYLRLELGE